MDSFSWLAEWRLASAPPDRRMKSGWGFGLLPWATSCVHSRSACSVSCPCCPAMSCPVLRSGRVWRNNSEAGLKFSSKCAPVAHESNRTRGLAILGLTSCQKKQSEKTARGPRRTPAIASSRQRIIRQRVSASALTASQPKPLPNPCQVPLPTANRYVCYVCTNVVIIGPVHFSDEIDEKWTRRPRSDANGLPSAEPL